MPTDDESELMLVRAGDVPWTSVSWIQVKQYEVERRTNLSGQALFKSLPPPPSGQRFSVEVVYKDDTSDRTHWLDSLIKARLVAEVLAVAHGLTVKVMP